MLHRDLKPANVVLRDDDPAGPVVVDFGLSFNTAADVEDITWTGQEIGNRFLRLSEAWQNRTAISDVTQLAGLFFFALTGVEPRMLLDDDGNAPHRCAEASQRLRTAIPDHDVRILTSLFLDKAFNTRASKRFQSAAEFRAALGDILVARPDTGTMEELLAGVDDYIARQDTEGIAADIGRLKLFANRARELAQAFEAKKLTSNCQAYVHEPGAVDLSIFPAVGAKPPPYDQFRFELRGADGVVLEINGHEVWTGTKSRTRSFVRPSRWLSLVRSRSTSRPVRPRPND